MEEVLPYRAEYSKSARAACKHCKEKIEKEVLRLAVMVQSPMFDGKIPHWYHRQCFFIKQRPKTVADIAHFDSLRYEDQEAIKEKVDSKNASKPASKGKASAASQDTVLRDFMAEYAKSGRSECRGCEKKIAKDEVRISKKDYESERARMYGPVDRWHHVACFVKCRAQLEFFESASSLPGYHTLSAEDKNMLSGMLKKIEPKRKAEDEPDSSTHKKIKSEDEEKLRKQSKKIFKIRDSLREKLKKKEMVALLEFNSQYIPKSEGSMLDHLADVLTFGALEMCDVCACAGFIYSSGKGYVCHGDLTEWTKCTNVVKCPKRKKFVVPEEFKDEFPFLDELKCKGVSDRIMINRGPTTAELKEKENGAAATTSKLSSKPLQGMKFILVGKNFTKDKKGMKDKIKELGGSIVTKIDKKTTAVITTPDTVGSLDHKIQDAKENNVHCVSEDFLDEVEQGGCALLLVTKKCISAWGGDVQERVAQPKKSKFESRFVKSIPDKQKVKLKGGAAVDPDSGLEETAHVYKKGDKIYNCVLGLVDIKRGTNSYYKLQLLESDNNKRYWTFRSWGRIGTTIGNNKLDAMDSLDDARHQFEALYEEKTGNRFSAQNFQKVPGCWYPLDIDYGQENEEIQKPLKVGKKSKLPKPVQELVALIFDVDTMKKSMVEFELDLKKMPLGKLSQKQIQNAYKILTEALKLLKQAEEKEVKGGGGSEGTGGESGGASGAKNAKILDCSNRFYTLIPHDFGMKAPPLLDNVEIIKSKIEMLDNLSEIEIAYSLLKSDSADDPIDEEPIDKHYRKLRTKIDVLERERDEYKMIEEYVENTHASTHSHYKLEVEEVFKIERQGEKKRYKPFKQLQNRKLLWHGSRLTNFAGILSQGLRIAPPEAPVTGYMFGKGIYFADMVSKSANYCATSSQHPTGLILLCEVALGNMYERTQAEYVEKLPKGMHSTKGVGRTCPDPSQCRTLGDGTEVPLGIGKASGVSNTSLLYNEYIVYDIAQVNVKYLLKLNFKYKF